MSALNLNEEQLKAWHSHPVTKALLNSLLVSYIDDIDSTDVSKERLSYADMIIDYIQDFGSEILNEA